MSRVKTKVHKVKQQKAGLNDENDQSRMLAHDMSEEEATPSDEDMLSGEEEDEDRVMSDEELAEKKPSLHSVRDLPSAQELRAIFESSELFRTNAFKLQIENLLTAVTPKRSKSAREHLDGFLLQLYERLQDSNSPSFLSDKPQSPVEVAKQLQPKGVEVPFPSPAPTVDTKWTFQFQPPESITLVGSWALNTSVKERDEIPYGVDLAVALPQNLLQEKDYLNDRVFHKRALYLACIVAKVVQNFEVDVHYSFPLGDVRRAVAVISSRKDSSVDWSKLNADIRIILVLPSNCPIPPARLSPSSSNLRVADSNASTSNLPTPHYNNLLAHLLLSTRHLVTMHQFEQSIPQFASAVRLLRVWANQRGFGKGTKSCVRGFEDLGEWWGCIIGLLVEGEERPPSRAGSKISRKKRRTLGRELSSYQLLRGTLDFLAHQDFVNEPVFMKREDSATKIDIEQWLSTGGPLFIDSSGTYNYLEAVPPGSLDLLRIEAAQTLKVLENSSEDAFSPLFLRELRDAQARFDVVLRVNIEGVQSRSESKINILDNGSYSSSAFSQIDRILRKALGDRIRALAILHPTSGRQSIATSHPFPVPTFEIGMILNPQHAFRLIDRGPKIDEDQEAIADFRALWGQKAELRRFADSAIVECVAWEVEMPHERAYIPGRIAKHILARHFNLEKVLDLQPSYVERILPHPASPMVRYSSVEKGGGFKAAMQAFEEVVRHIKAMDLPLSLVACLPSAAGLRYASELSPTPIPLTRIPFLPECASYIEVYDAILQFEKSGRWPDDLGAIQKVKLAWFENVARELLGRMPGCVVGVAMDSAASPWEDGAALELALPSGFAFRLRIYHDRERTLSEKVISDETAQPFERADAERALHTHLERFIHRPSHHAAIMNMHHRHVGFSPTLRLFKRWISSHYLSNLIPSELVELVCSYVFLRPDPQLAPHTGATGFARALGFLSIWDWRREALIIPLDSIAGVEESVTGYFPAAQLLVAETAFKERRTQDPGLSTGAWHVATDKDPKGVFWCLNGRGVSAMVADRITILAKACWKLIQEGGCQSPAAVKSLFTHPLTDYDFLIRLDPSRLPRYAHNIFADASLWHLNHTNVQSSGLNDGFMIGFDPACELVDDLQRVYGDTIVFFYDRLGGTTIAGSWNPLLLKARTFRALLGYSTRVEGSSKKAQVVLNVDGVLAEIARMGQGLIKEVIKQTR